MTSNVYFRMKGTPAGEPSQAVPCLAIGIAIIIIIAIAITVIAIITIIILIHNNRNKATGFKARDY